MRSRKSGREGGQEEMEKFDKGKTRRKDIGKKREIEA